MFPGFVFPLVIRLKTMCSDILHLCFRSLLKQRTNKVMMIFFFFTFINLNSLIWIVPFVLVFKKIVPVKNHVQPEGFSLCIFLCYLQGKLSLTVPTWARVGNHSKCSGLKTNYTKQTISDCPPQKPCSQGCQASQLQTGTVTHILTLSYSPVQRHFFPPWSAQPGVLFQLHWLMAFKGLWCQQSSDLGPHRVGLREENSNQAGMGMCQ